MSSIKLSYSPLFHIFLCVLAYGAFLSIYYFFSGRDHLLFMQLDGEYYALLINFFKEWAPPLSANVSLPPMGGLFNSPPPMNIWLNPGWLIFVFLGPAWGPILAQSFFAGIYMLGTYFFARNIEISIHTSLVTANGPFFLTHTPFQVFFLQFWMNPSVAFIVALEMAILALFIRAQEFQLRNLIFYVVTIAAIEIYVIILDPLWSAVLAFAMAPLFLPFLLVPMRALYMRLTILFGVACLVIGSGLITYIVRMQSFFARQNFRAEIHTEVQDYVSASMPWQGPLQLKLFSALMVGWLLTIFYKKCSDSQRRLAIGCFIHSIFNSLYSSLYIFTNINWTSLPLPAYLDVPVFSLYLIASAPGWSIFISLAKEKFLFYVSNKNDLNHNKRDVWVKEKPNIYPIFLSIVFIFTSSLIAYIFPSPFRSIDKKIPIINELREKISLHPGGLFRGSATAVIDVKDNEPFGKDRHPLGAIGETFLNFGESHNIPWLWKYSIPTLDQYSQTITPDLYFLTSRLLARPFDYQSRNYILSKKIDIKIMEMLGVRYVITDKDDIGDGALKRIEQTGHKGMKLFLFELPHPNLGHYSPTHEFFTETAHQAIEIMRSSHFDPRFHVVSDAHLPQDLIPASWATLTPDKDGMHIKALSAGQSLLVLPLQFSHCLQAVGSKVAPLVRVNLAMTGLLFRDTIDLIVKNNFGYWSSGCRGQDVEDMRRLKVGPDGTIKLPPHLHPFAIFHF